MISEVFRKGRDAKEASYALAATSTAAKNQALAAIADKAIAMKIGARGLRSVMEGVMTDVMYSVPSDTTASKIVITAQAVTEGAAPIVEHRAQ